MSETCCQCQCRFKKEIKTGVKKVYQWAYRNPGQRHWKSAHSLLTSNEAQEYFGHIELMKISGPYTVTYAE